MEKNTITSPVVLYGNTKKVDEIKPKTSVSLNVVQPGTGFLSILWLQGKVYVEHNIVYTSAHHPRKAGHAGIIAANHTAEFISKSNPRYQWTYIVLIIKKK